MSNHEWPTDQAEHIWTNWFLDTPRKGVIPAVQYRSCIHPACTAVQRRNMVADVPRA